jgi:hypothetical protein
VSRAAPRNVPKCRGRVASCAALPLAVYGMGQARCWPLLPVASCRAPCGCPCLARPPLPPVLPPVVRHRAPYVVVWRALRAARLVVAVSVRLPAVRQLALALPIGTRRGARSYETRAGGRFGPEALSIQSPLTLGFLRLTREAISSPSSGSAYCARTRSRRAVYRWRAGARGVLAARSWQSRPPVPRISEYPQPR